jgi:hypothetical protein
VCMCVCVRVCLCNINFKGPTDVDVAALQTVLNMSRSVYAKLSAAHVCVYVYVCGCVWM